MCIAEDLYILRAQFTYEFKSPVIFYLFTTEHDSYDLDVTNQSCHIFF